MEEGRLSLLGQYLNKYRFTRGDLEYFVHRVHTHQGEVTVEGDQWIGASWEELQAAYYRQKPRPLWAGDRVQYSWWHAIRTGRVLRAGLHLPLVVQSGEYQHEVPQDQASLPPNVPR